MVFSLAPSRYLVRSAAALAWVMLSACAWPTKVPPLTANENLIGLVPGPDGQLIAIPPDCEALAQPSRLHSWNTPRHDIAFGCATYSNLARQVAQPRDLALPQAHGGTDARIAGDAVQRYLNHEVTPLLDNDSMSTSGGR